MVRAVTLGRKQRWLCWSGGRKAFDLRRRLCVCCAATNWDWLGKGNSTLLASVITYKCATHWQCNTTNRKATSTCTRSGGFQCLAGCMYPTARVPSQMQLGSLSRQLTASFTCKLYTHVTVPPPS